MGGQDDCVRILRRSTQRALPIQPGDSIVAFRHRLVGIMIRLAFNALPVLSPLTGVGNYAVHLGSALEATGEVDVHAFYGSYWRHAAPAPPRGLAQAAMTRTILPLVKPFVPFRRELRYAQRQWRFRRGARRAAIDVYHEPNYVPFRIDAPTVISVHDISWVRYPDTHPRDRVRWLERGMPGAIASAAAIIVDSHFTRQEVIATFGVAAAKLHVTHLGVAGAFHPRTHVETRATLSGMSLAHGRYVLCVATIEPRKNLGHVLEAYAALPAPLRERYPLVIAGASGWRAGDLEKRLRRMSAAAQVRFAGHVHDRCLPDLYAGAAVFVFPSIYEGFGLPPLEAMASGVPVLVSQRASLPEVVGNAGMLLDPERPDLTAAGIESLLDDAAARSRMAALGRERALSFTWEGCARRTIEVYRRVLRPASG
jgi:glycosyltransferase involved in cell wall biosynthesis